MIAFLASVMIATNAPAAEVISTCRSMLPAEVELKGRIVLRNRRGIVQKEYAYDYVRKSEKTTLMVDGKEFTPASAADPILGTDITWSDITLDYLWWDEFSYDNEREGESVHGQVCSVIVMKKDDRTVRVWVDRKTGALMQAEEIKDGNAVRRLWGTRIKKFGERWMANVMEVETIGSGHRTKIIVEELDNER